MERIRIGEKEYEIVFNMYSMELIQEKYGHVQEIIQRITGSKELEVRLTKELFVILANTARHEKGEPEDVTGRDLERMHFEDWIKAMVREMIVIEIAAGMKSETTGGNEADDENHDVWLEEEEKNGLTGER